MNYSQLGINTDICNILARINISGVQSKVLWTRGHMAVRVTRGGVWELLYRLLHIVLYSIMQMQTLIENVINCIQDINNVNHSRIERLGDASYFDQNWAFHLELKIRLAFYMYYL